MFDASELSLDVRDRGRGAPIVVLPGMFGIESRYPVCDEMFVGRRTLTFTHPGCSGTKRPLWCNSVEDLAYAYIDEIELRALRDVVLVGFSLGGWVACEIAVRRPTWLSKMLLVDSLGVRAGLVTERSFADVFAMTLEDVRSVAFVSPKTADRYLPSSTDEDRLEIAQSQEALAAYGWKPYLHDPKLVRRLRRVDVPTLILWGREDKIANITNGELLASSIPGASFEAIAQASHHPHLDNPSAFAQRASKFLLESIDPPKQKELVK